MITTKKTMTKVSLNQTLQRQKEKILNWTKIGLIFEPNKEALVKDLFEDFKGSLVSNGTVAPSSRTFARLLKEILQKKIDDTHVEYTYRPRALIKGLALKSKN